MENASKAIIMAGGILIGVIILSVLVIVFKPLGGAYEEQGAALTIEQLEEYNRKFNLYDKSLYGSELLSLANLVADYNNRLLDTEHIDKNSNYYKENKIDVTVKLFNYIASPIYDENGVLIRTQYKQRCNERRIWISRKQEWKAELKSI